MNPGLIRLLGNKFTKTKAVRLVFSTYNGLFLLMLVEVFQLRNRITHGVTKIILKETELIEVN